MLRTSLWCDRLSTVQQMVTEELQVSMAYPYYVANPLHALEEPANEPPF